MSKDIAFQKGQIVRITGPDIHGSSKRIGESFKITHIDHFTGPDWFSGHGVEWYRASSLELVDELKIGGKVEVIGPCIHGYIDRPEDAKRFKISEVVHVNGQTGYRVLNGGEPAYSASSLRKVSKQSSGNFTVKFHVDTSELDAALKKIEEPVWKAWVEIHIGDIGKKLEVQKEVNSKLRKRCHDIEEKHSLYGSEVFEHIQKLEAWQKDHGTQETTVLNDLQEIIVKQRRWLDKNLIEPESPVISKILDEEPIQVGDRVEIVHSCKRSSIGKIMDVVYVGLDGHVVKLENDQQYTIDCLRKLPDAEIANKLNEGA